MPPRVSEHVVSVAGRDDSRQMAHLIYLHGFASSPQSGKVSFLSDRLAEHGLRLHCPDLNDPDFSTLTVSRMIDQVEALLGQLPSEPVVLFGSSLGAFVALHLAERAVRGEGVPPDQLEQLILLAPALEFGTNRTRLGGHGLAHWQETGWLEMTHYAYSDVQRVHYELFANASRYDSSTVTNTVPTLIVQGARDDVVDPDMVVRFAAFRPHVRLVMLDDGHQLGASLDRVWLESQVCLGLDSSA